jgi:hypothetical protein
VRAWWTGATVRFFADAFWAVVFFFVVDVWGAAHAPMARAAQRATGKGTTMSRKTPVYTLVRMLTRLLEKGQVGDLSYLCLETEGKPVVAQNRPVA